MTGASPNPKVAGRIDGLLALAIGALAFLCRFGFDLSVLDPHLYGWLLRGDMAQSFIGWLFFYFDAWHWPLGTLPHYVPVFPATLALADAHPWFSVLMKAIVPRGDEPLQFIGLWLATCYLLQGWFAMKIAGLFWPLRSRRVLLVALLSFSPILLYRAGHVSLCAHWLLLASLYLCLRQDYSRWSLMGWMLLAFLASVTHPYFLPPVASFSLIFYLVPLFRVGFDRGRHILSASFKVFICIWGSALFGLWLVGFTGGLGRVGVPNFYSADVFGFFDPQGQCFFLPRIWRSRMGQYEGYSYLGLGVLIMMAGSIYFLRKHRPSLLTASRQGWLVATLAASGLMIWSWGSDVRFMGHFWISLRPFYQLIEPLVSSFRSTGRFNWSMCYLLTILSFYGMTKYLPARISFPALLSLLVLQLVDVSPYYNFRGWSSAGVSTLKSAKWTQLAQKYHDIFTYPPFVIPDLPGQVVVDRPDYIPLAIFAAQHGMNLHSGAFVVPSEELLRQYLAAAAARWDQGVFSPQALYILNGAYAAKAAEKGLSCSEIDGYHVCVVAD